ncbi:zinc finger and SCAN domain-containing protein 5C-like isoform X3 [Aricia agestis]|uniref:zinc finger and SCAN domain-containing protein 5C-like isoform X3 n=1 Tax=Aricia agestis TaxID=91739 RepID=UPI001C2026EB|nr:zinc finger and SCAN domain-containing protein 5C-like isoform X3 [Aricia agestis]
MLKKTCCCICLSINKRTVNIYSTYLLYFYEQLANYKVRDSECWMCYICQTRLQQCHRLQQLAVQTRGLVDDLCQNKTHIDIGAIGSLLELSIYKKKNISTTHPTADNITEEPDIKTEQYNDDGIKEEPTVENTNKYGEDYATVLEFEDDDVSDSDAVCEQESLNVDHIDTWQGSRVLELKLVKLSQSVIDKYVRRSLTTQHSATEEHVGDKGECAGEQSVENNDKKAQYKSHKEQLSCDVCLKMFPTKSRLLRHIRAHTGKTFSCNYCLKKFGNKRYLKIHIKRHTTEKRFTCDICNNKFTTKIDLKGHLVIHTGEKQFNCNICQKKFLRKRHLKEHMLIHTGEKPYNCDICQKKFRTKSNLKTHMLIHTSWKP